MVLRTDSIQARLLRLEEVVTELRELAKLERAELRGSLRNMWAVERGLHLGAEILLDIGNHILSAQYGTTSDRYQDIIERALGAHLPAAGSRFQTVRKSVGTVRSHFRTVGHPDARVSA